MKNFRHKFLLVALIVIEVMVAIQQLLWIAAGQYNLGALLIFIIEALVPYFVYTAIIYNEE